MTNKKSTKRSLLLSALSLLLCMAMLVGTTFAWFTDSVTSGKNKIVAGNLDIELYHDGDKKVDSNTNLFDGVLWEPGVVIYENFTIKNEGNLALLYDFAMNWGEYNQMTEGGYNLTQVLKVAMVDNHVSGNREAVIAAGEGKWAALDSWSFSGEMTTKDETKDFALIIYWEPSDNDNNYNVQNGKTTTDGKELYVNLGINLQATQKMHESDSFGPDYDGLASDWDGSVGEVPEEVENVITITTGAELAAFAKSVNEGTTYSGKTVKLGADIDLGNIAWTPIGDCESGKYFQGTFDGQGYTIYNLNVDYSTDTSGHATAGLFGWVDAAMATVRNVNIDGATVKGSHWVGVIAGYFTGTIENCSVNNATVIAYNLNDDANGDKVGGIVGCLNEHSYLNNNTVSNSTITGNRDIGGIAGSVAASTYEMKNNKVENTVINYSTSEDYASAGEIVSGRTGYVADATNVATNVKIVKSVIVSTADELAAALKSTDKDIVITLANNIDVPITSLGQQTGGSGEYKLAGETTETITLDLNRKKLNITTTYWSNIGAKNDDAVFTIKNGTMTSSQATGTWNSYDVTFSNCNYVIENVVFEKAVAFANAGKTTTLKNVTINETHDYYALWITAEGQTVEIDGLTVNSSGRGIKIDEEYVDTPAKVTLKVSNADINTAKKAAIMVKSAAGADITLSNVNIKDTIDPVHAVWVDEDSADYVDLVTVTGGEKIYEGNVVSTATELAEAVAAGKTNLFLAPGTYQMPAAAKGKTLTISGTLDSVIEVIPAGQGEANGQLDYSLDGSTVTFNSVTIKTNSNLYAGYARLSATYNNCVIQNTYNLGTGNSEFNNCTFNITNDYLRVGGAYSAEFNGCTFNTDGRAILVFQDGTSVAQTVTVKDCTFNATAAAKTSNGIHVAAVSYDGSQGGTYTVKFEGNNVVDADFNGLWQIKDGENNVTVTGVENAVTPASTAGELTNALASGGNVVLNEDVETEAAATAPYGNKTGFVQNGGVLDGNGNTLSVECYGDDYGIMTSGGTIKNLTIDSGCRAIMIMSPTEDIIIDNVYVCGDILYPINTGDHATVTGIDLIVTNSTFGGWSSFAGIASASFTDCKFIEGEYGYGWPYETLVKPYVNTVFTKCEFALDGEGNAYYLDMSALETDCTVTLEGCTVNGVVVTAENCTTLFGEVELPGDGRTLDDCVIFK